MKKTNLGNNELISSKNFINDIDALQTPKCDAITRKWKAGSRQKAYLHYLDSFVNTFLFSCKKERGNKKERVRCKEWLSKEQKEAENGVSFEESKWGDTIRRVRIVELGSQAMTITVPPQIKEDFLTDQTEERQAPSMKSTEDWMNSKCFQEQLENSLSLFHAFHIKRNSFCFVLQNEAVVDDKQI